jgi:hypothetical protein
MKMNNKRTVIIFFILLITFSYYASSDAKTQVWKWTDNKGGVHYTNHLSSVPSECREKTELYAVYFSPPSKKNETVYTYIPPTIPKEDKKSNLQLYSFSDAVYPYTPPTIPKEDKKSNLQLKSFIEHLADEIARDEKIIKLYNNRIAFFTVRKSLKKDLPKKKKLLNAARTGHLNITNEIEEISKNINMEDEIVETLLNGIYSSRKSFLLLRAKNQIREALPKKKQLIKNLRSNKI